MAVDRVRCPTCQGDRRLVFDDSNGPVDCTTCDGRGYVLDCALDPRPEPSRVVRLSDGKPVDDAPFVDQVLVEKLESFLADARSGRAFSLAMASVTPEDGCVTFSHVARGSSSIPLLGAIGRLLHNLNRDLDKP